ncbi:MAG: hypothetical protein Kow0099_31360 [Candidatus Abyssubacteria bacterium]
MKGSFDFIGFNFYTNWYVRGLGRGTPKSSDVLSDRGYILYPEGMYEGLKYDGTKYDIPIHVDYVTQKRTIKESGRWLAGVIRNNSLPQ